MWSKWPPQNFLKIQRSIDLEAWIERKKNAKSRSFDGMDKICLLIFAFRLVKSFLKNLNSVLRISHWKIMKLLNSLLLRNCSRLLIFRRHKYELLEWVINMNHTKVLNNKSSLVVADLELDSNIQVPTYDHYRKW